MIHGEVLESSAAESDRRSPAYDAALTVIAEGVMKSTLDGFGEIKVRIGEKWVPIGEYLLFELGRQWQAGELSKDEYMSLTKVVENAQHPEKARFSDYTLEVTEEKIADEATEEAWCECECGRCQVGGGSHCGRESTGCHR